MHDDQGRLTMRGLVSKYREVLGMTTFTKDQIEELIQNLDNNAHPGPKYFHNTFMSLQDKARDNTHLCSLSSGAYGAVFSCKNAARTDRVIKEQFELISSGYSENAKERKYRDFFIEVLIQTLLSNDLQLGKHIPKIYSVWRHGDNKAYTEMKMMNGKTIESLYSSYGGPRGKASFIMTASIIRSFSILLDELHKKYKFVHMDFKPGNIGFTVPASGPQAGENLIQVFDFGSGCIQFDGLNIRARAFIKSDIRTSSCNPAADMALFLYCMHLFHRNSMDNESNALIEGLLLAEPAPGTSAMKAIERSIVSRGSVPTKTEKYHAAYNYYNTKFKGMDYLQPANVLATLIRYEADMAALKAHTQTRGHPAGSSLSRGPASKPANQTRGHPAGSSLSQPATRPANQTRAVPANLPATKSPGARKRQRSPSITRKSPSPGAKHNNKRTRNHTTNNGKNNA